jgi:hypothetical protein
VEFSFYSAGSNEVSAGENFLAVYPYEGCGTHFHWKGGHHYLKFDIGIDSSLFQTLIGHNPDQLHLVPVGWVSNGSSCDSKVA